MSKPRREAVQRFRSLSRQLRSTLLDLILCERRLSLEIEVDIRESLSRTCEWLAVVQSRRHSDVYDDVSMLMQVGLVHVQSLPTAEDYEDVDGEVVIEFSRFRVLDKFVKELVGNNPILDTHRSLSSLNKKLFSRRELMTPHQIRVLNLVDCEEVESVDLRGLWQLRSLIVQNCPELKEITSWKYLRELGWLEIHDCDAYVDYPDLQDLPSLRVCIISRFHFSLDVEGHKFDVSQCVRLRRLVMVSVEILEESGDLSSLKCLEELVFSGCNALSTVDGLSGVHSLVRLKLSSCNALHSLPNIGHMKELVYINISQSSVEEIPGIEKLVSLVQLHCHCSQLKHLPDLHHLPELRYISLDETPLIEDNTSSFYFDKPRVWLKPEEKSVLVDVTSISDTESCDDEDEQYRCRLY